MESQLFPADVSKWTWEAVELLNKNAQKENQYLEYKKHIEYPAEGNEKSKSEWRHDIEAEFSAFANASGGIIVFGMDDDGKPHPFNPPEHDVRRGVNQFIQNAAPVPRVKVSNPLRPPTDEIERIAVAVRVFEASRKPVKTSSSAFYIRINESKHPMSREQIESMFVEADRRQQAVRQLEMELDRFMDVYNDVFYNYPINKEYPEYHLIDIQAIYEAFRINTHLYAKQELSGVIRGIFATLRDIESQERYYSRVMSGYESHPDIQKLNENSRKRLRDKARRLVELIEILSEKSDLTVDLY